jgi:hypothetical protein
MKVGKERAEESWNGAAPGARLALRRAHRAKWIEKRREESSWQTKRATSWRRHSSFSVSGFRLGGVMPRYVEVGIAISYRIETLSWRKESAT